MTLTKNHKNKTQYSQQLNQTKFDALNFRVFSSSFNLSISNFLFKKIFFNHSAFNDTLSFITHHQYGLVEKPYSKIHKICVLLLSTN